MTVMKKIKLTNDYREPENILKRFSSTMSEKQVFKVPDGYFESLPARIQDEIAAKAGRNLRSSWLQGLLLVRKAWIPVLSVAIVSLVLLILLPGQNHSDQASADTQDTLNSIEAYDASYAGDAINEEYLKIYQTVEDPNLENVLPVSFVSSSNDGITADDIVEYLQEQELDSEVLAQL
jgi:hypothetical protein